MKNASKTFASTRNNALRALVASVAAAGLALAAVPAQAGVVYTATGTNAETGHAGQSAEADISLVGNTLTLILSNKAGMSQSQGDALTGILFNLAKPASPELISISLTPGSNLWVSGSSVNDAKTLWGSWTDKLGSNPALAANYGVATTGFNGEFQGGTLGLGNASPDYGIVGADTLPGSIAGSKYPYVENSLTFKIKVEPGILSDNDISNVRFLYGSTGQGWLQATMVTGAGGLPVGGGGVSGGGNAPEPVSFALLGIAMGAVRFGKKRAS